MSRDPRYDVLFEAVRIGPVTTKNRFFQVPHCNGMGYRDASALATMRAIKAQGGWGVVCTEQVEIHPSSDVCPAIELRIWDDQDIPMLERIATSVHEYGALAGLQLCHNGMNAGNLYSREVPLGPSDLPVATGLLEPFQARAMNKRDLRDLRRWHCEAAVRARRAGYDIIYVYAGKLLSGTMHFLSRRHNTRTDEYGGSLENRTRLLRELIVDVKEAVGDRCAIACRISVDELLGEDGLHAAEARDIIGLLAELPDLWDLTLSGWDNDSQSSRFSEEAYQEPFVRGVKQLTTKPIVGVGRFTSPDTMVRMIRQGILDLIGAARPSIADPFLPKKIEEGRLEDIRECIGCNICVAGDYTSSIIRCTQNPSMGEEWRRGWHPERIRRRHSEAKVLVIGAGPAGLEAAMMLGRRGYEVTLAERSTELGGRLVRERALPGLAAWGRVVDYRAAQIAAMPNVFVYYNNEITAEDVMGFGAEHVLIATGSLWRRDAVSRAVLGSIPIDPRMQLLTPDDLTQGVLPQGRSVLIYDDDHYYMGSVLAELLARRGYGVTLATPAAEVSMWTRNTMEQPRVQRRLLELEVQIEPHKVLCAVGDGQVELACGFTGRRYTRETGALVMVSSRRPTNELSRALENRSADLQKAGISSVDTIGDALAPATIAAAVFAGRRYAEELGMQPSDQALPFRREVTELLPLDLAALIGSAD